MKGAKKIFSSFILNMKVCAHNHVINTQNNKFSFKSALIKPSLSSDSFSFLDKYVKEGAASKKLVQDLKSYISSQKGKLKEKYPHFGTARLCKINSRRGDEVGIKIN